MPEVRKLTAKLVFMADYTELDHFNRRIDSAKASSSQLDRQAIAVGQSASQMGARYRGASSQVKEHTDSLKRNATQSTDSASQQKKLGDEVDKVKKKLNDQTRQTNESSDSLKENQQQTKTAAERVESLSKKLNISKSSLRAQTAGLNDMGQGMRAAKIKVSGLSEAIDLQKRKVAALKDQYAEMRSQSTKDGNQLHRMRMRINDETADLGQLRGELEKTRRSYNKLSSAENNSFKKRAEKYKSVGSGMRDAGEGLTSTAGVATLAVGGGLAYASKSAMDFQSRMSAVKSVMDPADVRKYSGALEHLAIVQGAKTKYSATEAAQAEEELVKAGVSVSDIMHGALAGSLNLATAGELQLKDAAEIASTALNTFHDRGMTVAKAADTLAGAANASATDVSEMKYSLSMSATVAAGLGASLKGTSTALAVFAQNGLKGSDAGTSLKTMLSRLHPMTNSAAAQFEDLGLMTTNANAAMQLLQKNGIKPVSNNSTALLGQIEKLSVKLSGSKEGTAKQTKEFQKLTMQSGAVHSIFFKANGQMKSYAQVAQILKTHLHGLNGEQRQAALSTMFGSDAIRGANIFYKEGAKGVNDMAKSMDKIKAADVARQKMNNFKGTVEQLKGSLETAGISMGQKIIPVLDWGAKKVQKLVDGFNGLSPAMKTTATAVTVGAGVILGSLTLIGGSLIVLGAMARGYGDVKLAINALRDRTNKSSLSLMEQRREMEKNTVAAENLSRAENNVGSTGGTAGGTTTGGLGGVDVDVGTSGKSGKKRGILSRIFRRKGSAKGAAQAVDAAEDVAGNVSKGGRLLKGVGTGAKWLGRGVAGLGIATSLIDLIGMTKNTAGSHIGSALGSMGGTWGGAAGGAALGTMIMPGVGTVIGGGIGAGVGSFAGSAAGKWAGGKIQGMFGGGKKTPAEQLDKGTGNTLKAYEKLRAGIDTKLGSIAASGDKYSKKTKDSIDKAYDAIAKGAKEANKVQEKATNSHLNTLVREKLMSASAAKEAEDQQKRRGKANLSLVNDATKQLKTLNDKYYEKMKFSSDSEERKLSDIRKKYGTQSAKLTRSQQEDISQLTRKYQDKTGKLSAKGFQKVTALKSKYETENVRLTQTGQEKMNQVEQKYANDRRKTSAKFSKSRLKLEKTLQSDVAGTMSNSAKQQKIILGKLKSDSGKISVDQASTIVKQARKARDGSISAANSKYKKVMDAADQEYFVTGSISKKQYESIKKKAEKQRDSAVSAANDQWHGTVSAAKKQAKGHVDQIDWETGKVLQWWDKMGRGISSVWNWFTKLFTGKSSGVTFGVQSKSSGKSSASSESPKVNNPHIKKYATGTTAGGHPGGDAWIGDNWQNEAIFTPDGKMSLSPAVPTLYKNLPAGTQVLNGNDTERIFSARAYAKGTDGFWGSIGDFLGKGFNWIKKGTSSAADYLLDKAGVGSVGDLGDLTHFTKKTAVPAVKKMLGSAISKIAHSSGAAAMGDIKGVNLPGSAKAWIAKGMKIAGVSGANWVKGLAVIAQHESGGNQSAVNRTDSNAKAGHPSAGLMQMIQSTFMAHAVKGHTTWMNPIDQVASAVGYIKSRYGGINGVPGIASMAKGGKYVGYAKGTKGAGAWAAKLFGGSKKKDDSQDKPSNLAISRNQATSINPTFNITINVNGNDKGMSENKIARLVQEKIEAIFGDLRQTADTGWEY